jgi:hypothetical protein
MYYRMRPRVVDIIVEEAEEEVMLVQAVLDQRWCHVHI